jgi:EAL domain-containing protein (putative c-di-GMP-specific phosphodiesterase class I)
VDTSSDFLKVMPTDVQWYLEGYVDSSPSFRRIPINTTPFLIGRGRGVNLDLDGTNVSRRHAELFFFDNALLVKDLNSRNGTFVNFNRIGAPTSLKGGDIIHFSTCEFRLGWRSAADTNELYNTSSDVGALPRSLSVESKEFLELMRLEAVIPLFQKIVNLNDGSTIGMEILSRGALMNFYTMPADLLRVAAKMGMEERFCRLLREKGMRTGLTFFGEPMVFINAHPVELKNPDPFMKDLVEIQALYPQARIVLEIPESLVTDLPRMRDLCKEFREQGFLVAYDDFGAGQARLMEMAESPPDFLKFDISLVRSLDTAARARRQMVKMFVKFASELGIITIAEGVETQGEVAAVREAGFDAAQGYYFGRPGPPESFKLSEKSGNDTGVPLD